MDTVPFHIEMDHWLFTAVLHLHVGTFSTGLRKAVNIKYDILTMQYEEEGVKHPRVISLFTAAWSHSLGKVGWNKAHGNQ